MPPANYPTTPRPGYRATPRRLAIALIAAGLGLAFGAEAARSATYEILICANPATGQGIGHADGWTQSTENQFFATSTSCSGTVDGNGGIQAYNAFASRADAGYLYVSPGSKVTFTAAADTKIKKLDLYRYARMSSPSEAHGWARIVTAEDTLLEGTGNGYSANARGSTSEPFGAASRATFESLDTTGFSGYVGCPNGCQEDDRGRDVPAHSLDFRLFGATVTLEDGSAPTVSAPTVSQGDNAIVTFEAGDKGGGLVEAKLEYDGVIDDDAFLFPNNNGGCTAPYKVRVPCVLSGNGQFAVSGIPAGAHNMRVRALDVAGNETVGPETQITIADGSAREGAAPASAGPAGSTATGAGTGSGSAGGRSPRGAGGVTGAVIRIAAGPDGSRRLKVRYGETAVLRGRLLDDQGGPIGGALLEVLSSEAAHGSRSEETGDVVRTRPDGGFSYLVGPGPSRTLRFVYLEAGGDPEAAPVSTVEVLVAARATLRASRASLRNGERVVLSGQLAGAPPAGKLVQLQVRLGRGWRTFAVTRTREQGRFGYRYRFTRTRRTTRYRFRALVPRENGYPYAAGQSGSVRVTVRGGPVRRARA